MSIPNYYEILNVPPTASQEQIERAYKRVVGIAHPDLFGNDAQAQAWANERMKLINEAHEVLGNPTKRAKYDQSYRDQANRRAEGPTGKRTRPPEEGRIRCPLCEGQGRTKCLVCQGKGDELCPGCSGVRRVVCPICSGRGNVAEADYWRMIAEIERAQREAEARAHAQAVAEAERRRVQEARAREARFVAFSLLALVVSLILFFFVRSGAERAIQGVVARRLALPSSHAQPASLQRQIPSANEAQLLPAVRSLESRNSVEYRFVNQTGKTLKVYWVDYSGKEIYYTTLYPGSIWTVATYATHPWRFREITGGRPPLTIVAKPRNTEVTLLPPE